MPKRRRDQDGPDSSTPKKARPSVEDEDVEMNHGERENVVMNDGEGEIEREREVEGDIEIGTPSKQATAPDTPSKQRSILKSAHGHVFAQEGTPKSLRKVLFSTPAKPHDGPDIESLKESPLTAARNADRSARRKSARRLFEPQEADDFDQDIDTGLEDALARDILDSEAEDEDEEELHQDTIDVTPGTPSKTPKPRGRPKGKKREPSPTPYDLPPHELFFFQNRTGGIKTSTNTLPSNALLNHDDFFAQINAYRDPHDPDKRFLEDLHKNSFDQWLFELDQGFNICLYGYGSKRDLLMDFAHHLFETSENKPTVVVINGYTPSIALGHVLTTIAKHALPSSIASKLPLQPAALLEALLSSLTDSPPSSPLYLLAHSVDAPPFRKPIFQSALSRLASHPSISLVATVDTLTFPLLWDISQRSALRFLFHDITTFAPWSAELDPVEETNALLGRSGRRVGGKDGVAYVLRSLPENARNLFRILVAEQLALADTEPGAMADQEDPLGASDPEIDDAPSKKPRRGRPPKRKPLPEVRKQHTLVVGVEYRTLYHKAVEEFVCSSEMSFRTLLKEFHDHAMVESKKDALGTERLSVPFSRSELEDMLEDLV